MKGFIFEGAHNRNRKSAFKQEQAIAVLIEIRFAFTGFYFKLQNVICRSSSVKPPFSGEEGYRYKFDGKRNFVIYL